MIFPLGPRKRIPKSVVATDTLECELGFLAPTVTPRRGNGCQNQPILSYSLSKAGERLGNLGNVI